MEKYDWEHLNHLQVGKYAEYLVKMELVRNGMDVYTSEVDDRGIDFVIRIDQGKYIDVQVKSIRKSKTSYIFFPKSSFKLRKDLMAAIVIFINGKPPLISLILSERWRNPDEVFKDKDYPEGTSPPEWGFSVSKKGLAVLEEYTVEKGIKKITQNK